MKHHHTINRKQANVYQQKHVLPCGTSKSVLSAAAGPVSALSPSSETVLASKVGVGKLWAQGPTVGRSPLFTVARTTYS